MIKQEDFNKFVSESFLDYPNNSDISIILYLPGCDRNCKGCQNSNLQYFEEFENLDILINYLIKKCSSAHTNKICLQGGDPLYKDNIKTTKYILSKLSKNYDICIYTGGDIEEVKKLNLQGFKFIKCGIFDESKYIGSFKTDNYIQFATSNQKLYNSDLKLISKDGIYYFNGDK